MRIKRGIAFLAAACLLFVAVPPAFADGFSFSCVLTLPDGSGQAAAKLTDGKNSTRISLPDGGTLRLEAEGEAAALSLSFDAPPGEYTVKTEDGAVLSGGAQGFLHEYIPLPGPARAVVISLPAGTILCEIAAYPPSDALNGVQQWGPPCADADMLVFSTHADDDQLWFGAAIATEVDRGRRVQVVFLTDHPAEPYRRHELLDALWTIGVRSYPVTADFPDYYSESLEHAKGLYDTNAMLGWQVEQLRRFRPEVVLGHDLQGEYGHGVHCLNAWLLTQAVEQSGDASRFPGSAAEYGLFDPPKTYLHLYPERQLTLDVELPLSAFGGKTAFEQAQLGYACHLSQQYAWFKVFKSGSYDCRKFGLYRTLVGDDGGANDLFEHISAFSDAPSSQPESLPPSSKAASTRPAPSSSQPMESTAEGDREAVPDGVLLLILILLLLLLPGGLLLCLFRKRRKRHETRPRKSKNEPPDRR